MKEATAFERLTATGYPWTIAKGQISAEEPPFAVGFYGVDANGFAIGDRYVFVTEGDNIVACIDRAVAWAAANPALNNRTPQ